jgi:hypothetical protein
MKSELSDICSNSDKISVGASLRFYTELVKFYFDLTPAVDAASSEFVI